jgi:hypothetical protein
MSAMVFKQIPAHDALDLNRVLFATSWPPRFAHQNPQNIAKHVLLNPSNCLLPVLFNHSMNMLLFFVITIIIRFLEINNTQVRVFLGYSEILLCGRKTGRI